MNLTIDHVSKQFGSKKALDDVELHFESGVYGILGANGSGKTTLMRILATVSKPSSGKVSLDGQDIVELDHHYRDLIGYLPQQIGLYKSFTAEKFLMYIASLKGLPKEVACSKVKELLNLVGLADHGKEKVGKFSGGMKQRVGIAQALLNDPKILIVDEPTAGLDPKERIRFRNLLSTIALERIVLLSTHIVSDIEYIAREIVIMKQGKVVRKDSPHTMLQQMKEKVWTAVVAANELPHYQENFKVGNVIQKEAGLEIRILSETRPAEAAQKAAPNLEDLYLYYFDEETTT